VLQDQPRLLLELSERLGVAAHRSLTARGVDVHTGARVVCVGPRAVALAGNEMLHAATTICTIGTRPNALVERMTIPVERGRIVVNPALGLAGMAPVARLLPVANADAGSESADLRRVDVGHVLSDRHHPSALHAQPRDRRDWPATGAGAGGIRCAVRRTRGRVAALARGECNQAPPNCHCRWQREPSRPLEGGSRRKQSSATPTISQALPSPVLRSDPPSLTQRSLCPQ